MTGGQSMPYLDMDPAPPLLPGTVRVTYGPIPGGWLKCDGSVVKRADYPDLFEAIGTQFGAGDGSTTFRLPTITMRLASGNVPDPTWMIAT